MLRKLAGIWATLALVLGLVLVLGVSGLALAAPTGAEADPGAVGTEPVDPQDDGDADTEDPSETEPEPDPEPEPEPEPEPSVVTATVSADQRVVTLVANDPSLADAARVVFRVWSEDAGRGSLIEHEAVQREDGSWVATAFIASNGFDDPGVPYNCRVVDAVHRLFNPYSHEHFFTYDVDEADRLSRAGWHYEGVAWVQPAESEEPADAEQPDSPDADAGDASDTKDPADAGDQRDDRVDEPTGDAKPSEGADVSDDADDPSDVETPGTDTDAPTKPDVPDDSVRRPVYRLYNPYSHDHLYTKSRAEYESLPSLGWRPEDVAFVSETDEGTPVYRLYNPYLEVGSHLFTTDEGEYHTLVANGWQDEGIAWYGDDLNADGTWCLQAQNRFHDAFGSYGVEGVVLPPKEGPAADDPGDDTDQTDAPVTGPTVPDEPTESPDPADPAEPADPTTPAESSALAVPAGPESTPEVVVGTTSFSISRPTATAEIVNVVNNKGTYDVVVRDISSPSGIAHVYVPTWTNNGGQDDIVWYEATRQSDGSYRATVDVNRHSFEHDFTSHVYLKSGNGIMTIAKELSQHLTLSNFIRLSGGPYVYQVSIFDPGPVGRVQMPTWSEQGGQDDLIWFDAHDNGNGWWTADVDASRLTSSGVVHTHVYADGQLRGTTPDYTIQPWEILQWRYRNMNNLVSGLASPTGWLLSVDTSNCFVGVYQGSAGNWRNLAWWDCAPGNPWTPTVKGIFHVGSRGPAFGAGYTCYWWTQFYGDYLFHSIKYYPGTLTPLDPTLGSPASHGCVRLAIENAKWIYDNIPSGTTVYVY